MSYNPKLKRVVMVVGYSCNNSCLFCSAWRGKATDRGHDELLNELKSEYANGCRAVEFIGGEATIRDDIISLVHSAKKIGYREIAFDTNGSMFANRNFTRKIIAAGLSRVGFSLHGHKPLIHDALTRRKGSFAQALRGLANVRKYSAVTVGIGHVINRLNFRYLLDYVQFIKKFKVSRCALLLVAPEGNALNNFDAVIPRLSEVIPHLLKVFEAGHRVEVNNVPLCLMGKYRRFVVQSGEKRNSYMNSEFNKHASFSENTLKINPPICRKCKIIKECEGLWVNYYNRYGDKELKPVL